MNFGLTSDQEQLRDHVKSLLDNECSLDYVERCDTSGTAPYEAFAALAKNGWLGLIVPEEYGGANGR